MGFTAFITDYLSWHYSEALRDMTEILKNFLWFGYNFFSIRVLLKTLFSPIYRIREPYKGLELEELAESFVLNSITRFIGFFIRSFLILGGLIFEAIVAAVFVPVLLIWLFLPAVLLEAFILGVSLIL